MLESGRATVFAYRNPQAPKALVTRRMRSNLPYLSKDMLSGKLWAELLFEGFVLTRCFIKVIVMPKMSPKKAPQKVYLTSYPKRAVPRFVSEKVPKNLATHCAEKIYPSVQEERPRQGTKRTRCSQSSGPLPACARMAFWNNPTTFPATPTHTETLHKKTCDLGRPKKHKDCPLRARKETGVANAR